LILPRLGGRCRRFGGVGRRPLLRAQHPAHGPPRHVHGEGTVAGHLFQPALGELFWRRRIGRSAGGVEAIEPLGLRVVDDGQQVAANAVHARLDDGENGGGGDRGIDGVAAILQHFQAGGRRQRLARGDHAVAANRGRPGAAKVARRTIAGLNLLGRGGGHDEEGSGQREEKISHGRNYKVRVRLWGVR